MKRLCGWASINSSILCLTWHFGASHSSGAVFSVVYTVMQFRDFVSFQLFEQPCRFCIETPNLNIDGKICRKI